MSGFRTSVERMISIGSVQWQSESIGHTESLPENKSTSSSFSSASNSLDGEPDIVVVPPKLVLLDATAPDSFCCPAA